jgi:polyhydroxyalkanoate synthesis repressor PhaR
MPSKKMPEKDQPKQAVLVIKKYPNRKLYNTRSSAYITLDEMAELVRQGVDLQVLDHASGDDLTSVTLSQILVDQERKRDGNFTAPLLSALVQAGGDAFEAVRRIFLSPFDIGRLFDEEIDRRINLLIASDEIEAQEGAKIAHCLKRIGWQHPGRIIHVEGIFQRYLAEHGYASQADVQSLLDQLEVLTKQVEDIQRRE